MYVCTQSCTHIFEVDTLYNVGSGVLMEGGVVKYAGLLGNHLSCHIIGACYHSTHQSKKKVSQFFFHNQSNFLMDM